MWLPFPKRRIRIERELLTKAQDDPTLSYPLITVRYGIHRCRAFLTWCDETLGTLHHLAERENGTERDELTLTRIWG